MFFCNCLKSPVPISTLRVLLNLPTYVSFDLFSGDEHSALWFYQTFCWRGESSQVMNISSYSLQSLRTSTYETILYSVERGRIFLKDCVTNTKQIYKTYFAKRSRSTDFTDSRLLRAVMAISMLFTPAALLDGHVSETTSTCKFFQMFFRASKKHKAKKKASIFGTHFTDDLLNCLKAQPQKWLQNWFCTSLHKQFVINITNLKFQPELLFGKHFYSRPMHTKMYISV